jgi:hypothetical protein
LLLWHHFFDALADVDFAGEIMEVYSKEIQVGNIIIELSIQDIDGTKRVVLTAKDDQNRRLWRTPILDNGSVKTYDNSEDALADAERKVASL